MTETTLNLENERNTLRTYKMTKMTLKSKK